VRKITDWPWSLILLTLCLAYAVYKQGGVELEDWSVSLLGLGILALATGLGPRNREFAPSLERWLWCPSLILLGYTAFQLVPLPIGLLKRLSPARAGLNEALTTLVGVGAAAPVSVIPSATWGHLLNVAGYTLTFLLVREMCWQRADRKWTLTLPLLTVAGLEAALGLAQSGLGEGADVAQGNYINRNHFAGLLEMVLPFAVMYALVVFRRGMAHRRFSALTAVKTCVLLALATLIFLGIVFSLSRMGFIASLCSLFVAGALAVGAGLSTRKRWLAVAAVAALIALSFVFLPPDALILRFASLASEDLSGDLRLQVWKDSLHLVAAYPLLGCGLGGYESAFLKFNTGAPMLTMDYAHNDYLQLLAELGILGFLIVAILMLAILLKAVSAALQHPKANDRYLGLACTGAMTAIFIHSVVDFNLYIPANALLLAWIAGIAVSLPGNSGEWRVARD